MKRLIWFAFLFAAALFGFWTGKKPALKKEKTILYSNVYPGRDFPLTEHKSFAVVIHAYNDSLWCERALRSVFEQDHDYCRVIFIDDGSADGTFEKAQQFVVDNQQEHRVILMRNERRQGLAGCLYRAADSCLDREIIVPLQGREWFAHPQILSRLNHLYQNPDLWIAFGQTVRYPDYEIVNPPQFERETVELQGFGGYDLSAPCSFYAGIFKQIQLQDLFMNGSFARGKLRYAAPLLELSGGRVRSVMEPFVFSSASRSQAESISQTQYKPLASFPKPRESNGKAELVLFSHNRPLQLYACLESIEKFLTGYERISVLVRAGNPEFASAYEEVRSSFPKVRFVAQPEKEFKAAVLKLVFEDSSDYVLFGGDDLVMKDFADLKVCMEMLEKTGAYAFYLRQGKNIRHSTQFAKEVETPPSAPLSHGVFAWDFGAGQAEWSLPHGFDLTLYRKSDLREAFGKLDYKNPGLLEYGWAQGVSPKKSLGLYFEQSKVVHLPLSTETSQGSFLTPEELLLKFNQGLKIDIEPLYKVENASTHLEAIPEFINR